MAAYAALVSLLNNIQQITNNPSLSTSLYDKHIPPLLEKIGLLLDFIEGNTYGGGSKQAQDLERKIATAAHTAEDLIESHIVDQILKENPRWPSMLTSLIKAVVSLTSQTPQKSVDLQQLIEDMDAILQEAKEFKEESKFGAEQLPTHLAKPLMESGESAMVGLDAELTQLLGELTGYQSNRSIISVVGMGGSGKTTLAKNVYENKLIKEHFQFRAWATISQQNNAKEVLSKLLSGIGDLSRETVDDLGLKLHKTLSGRRYLIVLDDIWSVTAWDEVKRFFPDNNNGSRILLTTRLSNVAKDCGSSLFTINLLDKENSWNLFRQKAFENEDCPPDLIEVGEEIVRSCKGLALSIVVIGGLLSKSPRTLGYWRNVANHLKSIPNSEEKQESLDVLTLSYNHLPPHLKPCFLYMGVFKEDSKIRVSKIIKLWVAEGFIKPIGSHVLEEIAEGYLKDLIDRNLVLVDKRRKNGKLGSCSVHDLLRDLCIQIAEEQDLFRTSKGEIRGTERRLVDEWCLEPVAEGAVGRPRSFLVFIFLWFLEASISPLWAPLPPKFLYFKSWLRHCLEPTGLKLPLARSIIARTYVKQPARYRLLRVLDEERWNPEGDYYGNFNLRYLEYERSYKLRGVWNLPTSVSHMWNLQTLTIIIGDRSLLVVAPSVFWRMRQLRHLECYRIYLPSPLINRDDESLMLENLQTLKTTMNLRLSEEMCEIIPYINELHMDYDSSLQGYDNGDSLIESVSNLNRLQKLESLNMTTYISRKPDSPDRELSKKLPGSFPSSLKKLTLSECEIHWENLTLVGSLPYLEVLKLKIHAMGRGNWSPISEQFRRLKFLEIYFCDLVCWDADASHFPVLEKLHLGNLYSLEEIPLGIGDIPTLQLIRVYRCGESVAVSAVKIKEEQLEIDNDIEVQVNILDTRLDTFNQMLEAEGLTIDNIHFQTS